MRTVQGEKMNQKQRKALIARVESSLLRGAEEYFIQHGFVNVPTVPHIVDITGACENVDTLYSLNYHGREAFLTQTGQTALELLTSSLEKVCCTIHSFRAEETVDARHLTEFPLIEFEFRYEADGFPQLLSHIENTIHSMVNYALKTESGSLQELGADVNALQKLKTPFPRIAYDDAVKMLDLPWGSDLKHEHEAVLTAEYSGPVFVTKYPEKIKFFNMQRNKDNPQLVNSADLLLPYSGEAVGSAVREHDYNLLVEKLRNSEMFAILSKRGKILDDFKPYLEEVRDSAVPHAGCGIGLCRVTQFVLGSDDIREATVYPRNKDSK